MVAMLIEHSETRVEAYSSDLPVSNNVAISWTPAYVLCVWCFNGNINYLQYFQRFKRSLLTTEQQTELTFDRYSIVDLC